MISVGYIFRQDFVYISNIKHVANYTKVTRKQNYLLPRL